MTFTELSRSVRRELNRAVKQGMPDWLWKHLQERAQYAAHLNQELAAREKAKHVLLCTLDVLAAHRVQVSASA